MPAILAPLILLMPMVLAGRDLPLPEGRIAYVSAALRPAATFEKRAAANAETLQDHMRLDTLHGLCLSLGEHFDAKPISPDASTSPNDLKYALESESQDA